MKIKYISELKFEINDVEYTTIFKYSKDQVFAGLIDEKNIRLTDTTWLLALGEPLNLLEILDTSTFKIDEVGYTTATPFVSVDSLIEKLLGDKGIRLKDNSFLTYFIKAGSGSSASSDTALLRYIFKKDSLVSGTELTQTRPSVPQASGSKGFLTSVDAKSLLSFYEAFAYNEDNYKLIIDSGDNVEISFLCSDRRYGVAGSRRGWSPYFKLRDLIGNKFIVIQDILTGSDQAASYNIRAKITVNANTSLFITIIDTHSGENLYGSIINIRHRIV